MVLSGEIDPTTVHYGFPPALELRSIVLHCIWMVVCRSTELGPATRDEMMGDEGHSTNLEKTNGSHFKTKEFTRVIKYIIHVDIVPLPRSQ